MWAIPVALVLIGGLCWLRRGNGGGFGQAIRNSDYHAWRMEVGYQTEQLEKLKAAEPRR